jgi:hypothetical protein
MDKLESKIKKFLDSHNYNISEQNLNFLTTKLYNSNLFENYEKQFEFVQQYQNGGSTLLPPEYFGVEDNNYVNSNEGTNMEPINNAIRPPLTSNVFPMNGGGCPSCMEGGMYKGCGFFTNSDMALLKKNKVLNFNNKQLNENKEFLNNKVTLNLHKLFNSVKNKQNLIGKSHINKL